MSQTAETMETLYEAAVKAHREAVGIAEDN